MTIHIYGDSFAADHGQYDYNPKSKTVDDMTYHAIHENTWPDVLSKLKTGKRYLFSPVTRILEK